MAGEGAAFEAEAAKAFAAAERALLRAQQLNAAIEKGQTTAQEVESRIKRAVSRDRVAGETIGEKPASAADTAARDEAAIAKRTQATRQENLALREQAQVQSQVNRTRQLGNDAAGRAAFLNRYGAYPSTRNVAQQQGLIEDISRIRQQAYYGGAGAGGILPPAAGGRIQPPAAAPLQLPRGQGFVGGATEYDKALQSATTHTAALRAENERFIQVQGLASNAMRRHGALTTEFISAAARGEVTIRELGFQTAATIGKFAGWLGAGAAIFGVTGALTELGKGALDAYAGVNQVQRVIQTGVDPSALRKQFRDLSGEFNLPIGTVTDAVYQMGKVFHSTDQAVEASRAVLYSVKVGELDVADATRYLIAITNGFHLPAQRMADVFDTINRAQNQFGITIADVEAGMAKASGQFHATGGDYQHLIAIITTAQKVTGQTGQVIGTGIARAPNFLRQAANQQALREFGIKASTNVQNVLTQAFNVAQKLPGKRVQDLAAAIFGPQYGARFGTGLLENAHRYKQVLDDLQNRSAGSAQKELQTQLGGVNEQLTKVLITLQRIGGSLAEAGGLDLFFVAIKALNGMLSTANSLLETFNQLPAPLRHALSIITQLLLILRLARRFQLGESIAGGISAQPTGARRVAAEVFSEGDRGLARKYRAGLFAEQTALEDRRTQITSGLAQASGKSAAAQAAVLEEQRKITALGNAGAQETEAYKNAVARQAFYAGQVESHQQTLATLGVENAESERRLGQVNESLTQTRRRYGLPGLNVQGALAEARRTGGFIPGLFQRPATSEGVEQIATDANKAVGRQAASMAAAADAGALPESTPAVLATATSKANTATRTAGRVRANFSRAGAALNRMIGGFGNLLFGVFAFSLALDEIHSVVDSLTTEFDKIDAAARSQDTSALATYGGGNTFQDTFSDFLTSSGQFHGPIAELLGIGDKQSIGDIRRQTAAFGQATVTQELAAQNEALRAGKGVPYLNVGVVQKRIEDLKTNAISRKKAAEILDKYDVEIDTSLQARSLGEGTTKKQRQQVAAAQRALQVARADTATNKTLANRIRAFQEQDLEAGVEASLSVAAAATNPAAQRNAFQRARIYMERINQNLAGSHNATDLQTLAEQRSKFFQGVTQTVQDELDRATLLARSPEARADAYAQAYSTLRQQLIAAPQNDLQRQRQRVEALRAQVRKASQAQAQTLGDIPGIGGFFKAFGAGDVGLPDTKKLEQLRTKLHAQTDNAKAARKFLQESERQYHQMRREIEQQQYEEQAAIRQARTDLRTATTADPLKQARIQLDFLGTEIDRAIKEYGRGSQQVLSLMQQRQQALAQQAQAQLALIQAQGGLREAGINQTTDPIGYARTQISDLQQQLAFMQAHANRFDPAQIIQLEAQIQAAQVQLQQTIYEQATQLREAAYDIRIAQANYRGDPVRAARIELSKAEYALRRAQTPTEARQARGQVIQQRQALEEAIFSSRLATIQFEADIDKTTTDQEIRQLQNLLHLAHITQEQRRQIRTQIHQLRQQQEQESAGFDLDLGNIKLPTIYEIRRAIKGGVGGANTNIQQTQNNKVTINVNSGKDAKKVGKELDDIINGGATNALRSAGV